MLLMKSFQLLSASSYRMVMVDAGIQLRDAYSVLEGSGGGGSPLDLLLSLSTLEESLSGESGRKWFCTARCYVCKTSGGAGLRGTDSELVATLCNAVTTRHGIFSPCLLLSSHHNLPAARDSVARAHKSSHFRRDRAQGLSLRMQAYGDTSSTAIPCRATFLLQVGHTCLRVIYILTDSEIAIAYHDGHLHTYTPLV